MNNEIIQRLNIPSQTVEAVTRTEEQELTRCERAFRSSREPVAIAGRTVILVDDGLATGASMRAAARALRQKIPRG